MIPIASVNYETLDEMHRLVAASLAGSISPEEMERLEELVGRSIELRNLYLDIIHESSILLTWAAHGQNTDETPLVAPDQQECKRPSCDSASIVTASAPAFYCTAQQGAAALLSSGWPVAYLIATVIFAVGALIGNITHVSRHGEVAGTAPPTAIEGRPGLSPRAEGVVGRITGVAGCTWAGDSRISLGQRCEFAAGLMEITYDSGAKVILQGPVTYEVESRNGGFLHFGKLSGKIENPRARGFGIRTPNAIVTDLGTEFGVQVDGQAVTTVRVYRGTVKAQLAGDRGETKGNALILHENQSARVDNHAVAPGGNRITLLGSSSKLIDFILEIPKPKQMARSIDLVDVVAGGDGFSGKRGRGINPITGHPTNALIHEQLNGDVRYRRTVGLPMVDGVFIPDGGSGPVQIDSAGHMFGGFCDTEGRMIWGVFAASGNTSPSRPSAESSLPIKASEAFPYKYEMDWLPSDVVHVDADGNGQPDFVTKGKASVSNGILVLEDGRLDSSDSKTIWPKKFSIGDGYTIETKVKVVSSFQSGPCGILAALPANHSDVSAWLNVGNNELTWGPSVDLKKFNCDTTDAYHVYRIVQRPREATFAVWRDGILVRDDLPIGADTGGFDRFAIGDVGEFWGGMALVDYVRFTPGAFAPVPPSESIADQSLCTDFGAVSAKIGGVDYASPGHGALLLHANVGVTFDLDVIRRANAGHRLLRFQSTAGCIETASMIGEALWTNLWVIVDGKPRYRLREINGTTGAMPISIPLSDEDRFLTLVVTDGGNGIRWDGIVFGDPRLTLTPARKTPATPSPSVGTGGSR